jgi:putative serine protease PepD
VEPGDLFDDDPSFRAPPSPEDRLWRHPSELGWTPRQGGRGRPTAVLALLSGVAGAAFAIGVLAATGTLSTRVRSHDVIQREMAAPLAIQTISDSELDQLASAVMPSVVVLRIDGASAPSGAGVVFRDDGHVLTNAHVVASATSVEAVFRDGRTASAKVVGTDRLTDLAVLKLSGDGPFVPAAFGTSDGVAVGDLTVAVGTQVSSGVVSALGREISAEGELVLDDLIQTDAEIDPASSGGALLRDDGGLIGITTAYAGSSRMGFATPVDVARVVADDLVALGRVRVAWLGIRGTSAPDSGGVVVAELFAGGPAEVAGLVAGDVIRRIDGHPVASMTQLRIVLRRSHPGESVRAVFDRDGRRHELQVVLAERESAG